MSPGQDGKAAGPATAEACLALCELVRDDLRELAYAGDDDAAGLAGPAGARTGEIGRMAGELGQAGMAELCGLMTKVLERIAGNAALAKPSILGVLTDALDKLEAMSADPERASRVDAARILFQLELACGPSKARH